MDPQMMRKAMAEFLGTFWLVFAGVGSVVFWQGFGAAIGGREVAMIPVPVAFAVPHVIGIALCFGLAVTTMAYTIGHISGCHLNPAVSVGLVAAGRMPAKDLVPYIVAQVAGGLFASVMIYVIAKTSFGEAYTAKNNSGATDYHKLLGGLLAEIVMTYMFLMIILGATSKRAPAAFAGLVIGLALVMIHLFGIALTGVSVNPARSIGPALFARGDALKHLWIFLIAPPIGAVLAGLSYKMIDPEG